MLSNQEIIELIAVMASLDRFTSTGEKAQQVKAEAWRDIIAREAPYMTFARARQIVIAHYGQSDESLSIGALCRRFVMENGREVFRAKMLGLVAADWGRGVPLPDDVRLRLVERLRVEQRSGGVSRRLPPGYHSPRLGEGGKPLPE